MEQFLIFDLENISCSWDSFIKQVVKEEVIETNIDDYCFLSQCMRATQI